MKDTRILNKIVNIFEEILNCIEFLDEEREGGYLRITPELKDDIEEFKKYIKIL